MEEIIFRLLAAFGAALCFSVLFSVDKKQLMFCGLAGSITVVVYTLLKEVTTGAAAVLATAVAITLISRELAIIRRSPVTVFLVPGIIPLAPGADMYNMMYAAVTGSHTDVSTYGYEALAVAGAVAIGIALAFSLPNKIFLVKTHK